MDAQDQKLIVKQMKELDRAKNWDTLLEVSKNAAAVFQYDDGMLSWYAYAKEAYVTSKLNSDTVKKLRDNGDFVTLKAIYLHLLQIFPEYGKLKRLLEKLNSQIEHEKMQGDHGLYAKSWGEMEAKMQNSAWDDALEICENLERSFPASLAVKKIKPKILKMRLKEVDKAWNENISQKIQALAEEYKGNPDQFLTIS